MTNQDIFSFIGSDPPMTDADHANLMQKHPGRRYLVFPEDRTRPIHMLRRLPARWLGYDESIPYLFHARPGEHYAFQIGVYAVAEDVHIMTVSLTGFTAIDGTVLPPSAFTCYNTSGVDCWGRPFKGRSR